MVYVCFCLVGLGLGGWRWREGFACFRFIFKAKPEYLTYLISIDSCDDPHTLGIAVILKWKIGWCESASRPLKIGSTGFDCKKKAHLLIHIENTCSKFINWSLTLIQIWRIKIPLNKNRTTSYKRLEHSRLIILTK